MFADDSVQRAPSRAQQTGQARSERQSTQHVLGRCRGSPTGAPLGLGAVPGSRGRGKHSSTRRGSAHGWAGVQATGPTADRDIARLPRGPKWGGFELVVHGKGTEKIHAPDKAWSDTELVRASLEKEACEAVGVPSLHLFQGTHNCHGDFLFTLHDWRDLDAAVCGVVDEVPQRER